MIDISINFFSIELQRALVGVRMNLNKIKIAEEAFDNLKLVLWKHITRDKNYTNLLDKRLAKLKRKIGPDAWKLLIPRKCPTCNGKMKEGGMAIHRKHFYDCKDCGYQEVIEE